MNMKDSMEALSAVKKFVVEKAGHTEPTIETDPAQILACIKFMERVFSDVVVVVCARDRVSYVSANCSDIIGYNADYFRSLNLEETLALLHEDDVKGFRNCIDKMTKVTSRQYDSYKYLLLYRIRNPQGGFHLIEDEKIAVGTTPGKFIFITLLRNVSREKIYSGVKLTIQKKIRNTFALIDEYIPETNVRFTLSNRQLDIINLVAMGLSNKAIADRLHLSINTVKNHKQLLFRKLNVKNNIEMVNSFQSVTEV